MKYILIAMFFKMGFTAEFDSRQACEQARQQVIALYTRESYGGDYRRNVFCTPKGGK